MTITILSYPITKRRAFLTSSDEGMSDTFRKYCLQTIDEIYIAVVGTGSGSSNSKTIDEEKLVNKVLQFFPNLKLSVEEVRNTPIVSIHLTIIIYF